MDAQAIARGAESAFKSLRFTSENAYRSAVGSAHNAFDSTQASFYKTCSTVVGGAHAIAGAGITIALVTAPVPTMIGVAMLWLVGLDISAAKQGIDKQLAASKRQRTLQRAVSMLEQHGRIPQNALVATPWLRMEISATDRQAEGTVLTGMFKGSALSALAMSDLRWLVDTCDHEQTESLLTAYMAYRQSSAGGQS